MKKRWVTGLAAFACTLIGALCLTACEDGGNGGEEQKQGYNVTFTVDGETYLTLASDGELLVLPSIAPEKEGYIFDGWDYDPSAPLTEGMEIKAKWRPMPDMGYMVEHLVKNPETGDWRHVESYWETGETDSTVTAEPLNPDYYIYLEELSTPSGAIQPDGSLRLCMYYELQTFTVTYDGNGGTLVSGELTQEVPYGYRPIAPVFEMKGHSYTFDKDFEFVSKDMCITANWTANKYGLYFNLDNGERGPEFYQDYGTPIDLSQIVEPQKIGYKFVGWDREIPTVMDEGGYIKAQYKMLPEMEKFDFYSWRDKCVLYGALDTTVTSLTIPDYVTEIEEGAFKDCTSLETLTLPYLGLSLDATKEKGHLGAIFGWRTSSNTGNDFHYTASVDYTYYIPETLKEVHLTGGAVKSYGFRNCRNLETVTLPSDATVIGHEAFYHCEKLVNIELPQSVVWLSDSAFEYCSLLKEIDLPESLTVIGNDAFRGCKSLEKIEFGEKLETIYSTAFEGCESLQKVRIPDSVTTLSLQAFASCKNLKEVYIGSGVTSFESSVFMYSNVEKLTLPKVEFSTPSDGIKRNIGWLFGKAYASDQYSLPIKSVELYDTTYIYKQAFYKCPYLETVVLPDTVEQIGDSAFEGCAKLKNFTLPKNIQLMGKYVFKGCQSLPALELPKTLTQIGESTFEGCASLTEFSLHENIESIGANAFKDCANLAILHWSDSVTSVSNNAFENCALLAEVRIDDLHAWCSIDFESELSSPLNGGAKLYVLDELITRLVVPETVKTVKAYTFYSCTQITDVEIPANVTSIEFSAFEKASNIEHMTLPFVGVSADATNVGGVLGAIFGYETHNSATKVGNAVYQYDKGGLYYHYYIPFALKKVDILGGKQLSENAFFNSQLHEITIGEGVKTIGWSAFEDCEYLKTVTLPKGVETIDSHAFNGCTALETLNIPNSLQTLGSCVFQGCNSLIYNEEGSVYYLGDDENPYVVAVSSEENIIDCELKEGTKQISWRAFGERDYLQSIVIPDTVEAIGDNAFAYCYDLESVKMGGGVKKIGTNAFYCCRTLAEISLPDGVTTIGSEAFNGTALKSFKVPLGVTYLPSNVVYSADLEEVVLHDGVETVDSSAFGGCTNLAYTEYENGRYLGTADNPYYLLAEISSTELTEFNVHPRTRLLKNDVFVNCTALTKVTLGEDLQAISVSAFNKCASLTEIAIPDSIVEIRRHAFVYCSGLTSIVIGKNVGVISMDAFYAASNITAIYYKGTAEDWEKIEIASSGNWAFCNASRYYYSETEPTESGNYWHYGADGKTVEIWA